MKHEIFGIDSELIQILLLFLQVLIKRSISIILQKVRFFPFLLSCPPNVNNFFFSYFLLPVLSQLQQKHFPCACLLALEDDDTKLHIFPNSHRAAYESYQQFSMYLCIEMKRKHLNNMHVTMLLPIT